ncbi:hypothetical protein K1719_027721 [Acacia pycnantha]|nr:hypothetical protein K1719_027721 [Acacia pycnantha]
MNMESHYVIFLCSTHGDPSTTLKRIINNGMTTFQRTVKKRRGFDFNPKWYQPKTRRQPPESNLCGPYVMKHIYDIVTEGKTKFPAKRFACEKPFDDEEVEHIRHVFCEYLYKLVLENLSQDNN